jgi:hypothetical protein
MGNWGLVLTMGGLMLTANADKNCPVLQGDSPLTGPWLKVDFTRKVLVSTVSIEQWEQQYMVDWTLWSSDNGVTWTNRMTKTGLSSPQGSKGQGATPWIGPFDKIPFDLPSPAEGRYWLIHCTKISGGLQLRNVIFS